MKKLWIFLLVATLCLTVVACANDGNTDAETTDEVTTVVTDAPSETDPPEETDPPADTKEVDPADVWKDVYTNAVQDTNADDYVFPNK